MNPEFLRILDKLRDRCKFPFIINSGFRTKEHNARIAKVETSAHTTGDAVDIKVESSWHRMVIVRHALELGIARIGIGNTFIHLDISLAPDKPQNVMWLYP